MPSNKTPATASAETLIDLEKKFWQSIVDQDPDTATSLLKEPALMVSSHGAFKFNRNDYRKMANEGTQIVTSFDLDNMDVVFPNDATAILTYRVKQDVKARNSDEHIVQEMNDTSTWVRDGERWLCVMHTETPVESKPMH
jgi:hypothetical protein